MAIAGYQLPIIQKNSSGLAPGLPIFPLLEERVGER